ncbi:hypothetical protein [Wolbachia endosymbiont of Pentidionis agamae]|uniref:hypothetical protein n=1 Tax=Wolbachia endosymbiont of Pentidionis agamae TaxID=3110435 RepID=UPI002FD24A26
MYWEKSELKLPVQNMLPDLKERAELYKDNEFWKFALTFVEFSADKFASHIPDESLRKDIINYYKKEILPVLNGRMKEKMQEFITDFENDGWEKIKNNDCIITEEKFEIIEHSNCGPIQKSKQRKPNIDDATFEDLLPEQCAPKSRLVELDFEDLSSFISRRLS